MLLKPEEVDEINHIYQPSGVRVPSVTDVLKAIGFIRNSNSDVVASEYYMERGRQAHKAIALFQNGNLDWHSVDTRLTPYLDAWRLFVKESGIRITAMEEVRYSEDLRLAGRLDWLGELPSAGWVLGDTKTGPVMPWTGLQLALYDLLGDEPYKVKRWGLELTKDGKYKIKPFGDWCDYATAQAAVKIYWWQVENCLREVGQ